MNPPLAQGPAPHGAPAGFHRLDGGLHCDGVPVADVARRVRVAWPESQAFYLYSAALLESRVRRFLAAFEPLHPHVAYALKANALPWLLERLAGWGLGADVVSRGEIHLAERAAFPPERVVLNGNGKSRAELEWAADRGPHSVNVDCPEEMVELDRLAAARGSRVRVATRINPGVPAPGHPYVATGTPEAKFGMSADQALEVLAAAARSPNLAAEGVHVHVGSQILDPEPLLQALDEALAFRERAARRGLRISLVNLGGGFGVSYDDEEAEFPLESYARELAARVGGLEVEWALEPGRWLVAPCAALVARVRWVKRQGARRIAVLEAGMNDLLRPALYGAHHRLEAVTPRPGPREPAAVVGPLCESADVFAHAAPLPPLEPGDLVAVRDVGAYGAAMASNYNGRGRLAEVVVAEGSLRAARSPESWADLARGACDVEL